MAISVLIVEDDPNIRELLQLYLEKDGYAVTLACDGGQGLDKFRAIQPDLVLLDVMMPVMDGWAVCRAIRAEGSTPVIMLTAKSQTDDKVQGLKTGADDYITKPFRVPEVIARVGAVLRRTSEQGAKSQEPRQISNDNIIFEGIVVNKADMSLTVDGEVVVMTRKEIELLCYLLTHRGQILSREHLLNNVWDSNGIVLERTVDVHITHLRRKLGQYGKYIKTKSGYGYLFEN